MPVCLLHPSFVLSFLLFLLFLFVCRSQVFLCSRPFSLLFPLFSYSTAASILSKSIPWLDQTSDEHERQEGSLGLIVGSERGTGPFLCARNRFQSVVLTPKMSNSRQIESFPPLIDCISTIKSVGFDRGSHGARQLAQLFTSCLGFLSYIRRDR